MCYQTQRLGSALTRFSDGGWLARLLGLAWRALLQRCNVEADLVVSAASACASVWLGLTKHTGVS